MAINLNLCSRCLLLVGMAVRAVSMTPRSVDEALFPMTPAENDARSGRLPAANAAGADVPQAIFYASPAGTADAPGTANAPCSLEAARNLIRKINGAMTGDIAVSGAGANPQPTTAFGSPERLSGNTNAEFSLYLRATRFRG